MSAVVDQNGNALDAECSCAVEGDVLRITFESQGQDRNKEYNKGVEVILGRLAECGAFVQDAYIDTRKTRQLGLNLEQRRTQPTGYTFPIALATLKDIKSFRRNLGKAQASVARTPGAKGAGNPTKRLVLEITISDDFEDAHESWLISGKGARYTFPATLKLNAKPPAPLSQSTPATSTPQSSLGGQGRGLNATERRAVELHAMDMVRAHYANLGWECEDTSSNNPFDFRCTKPNEQDLIVEVKGATGSGERVLLTKNEITAARKAFPNSALAVVCNIELERDEATPQASGGKLSVIQPWYPENKHLVAERFNYSIPDQEPHNLPS
jgi:hypothetical protein